MVNIICGWCSERITIDGTMGKYGYGQTVCPKCGRLIPSSKKDFTGNTLGRKHIHMAYRDGDRTC